MLKTVLGGCRWLLLGVVGLIPLCVLSACVNLQGFGLSSSPLLPKVEITPPADYTKGAPSYTMHFKTFSSSMPGSVGLMAGGDQVMISLRMVSHPGPAEGASPKAYHMIPPGMKMGDYLPLLPPEKTTPGSPYPGEKPDRMTIKTYWSCGENVGKGQPKVVNTSNLGSAYGKGYAGLDRGGLKPGWVEVLWPNKEHSPSVSTSASLIGEHFIHGNFLPHMRFNMDAGHDIMAKLSVSTQSNSLTDAIPVSWNKLPTAIGYHVMAMSFNDKRKEVVIWTSSEKSGDNVSGQFLDAPQVRKHIASKVILPEDRTTCVIPKGIFADADTVIITVTAWGDDYWASSPPRPAKVPKNWTPDWSVKGQFLSVGTLMLGDAAGGADGGALISPKGALFNIIGF